MAGHNYKLILSDGTTSGTLTASPYSLDYEGVDLRCEMPDVPTVTNTLRIRIRDGTPTDNLDEMRKLNALLRQATEAQTNRTRPKVYLNFTNEEDNVTWRSEIVAARADWEPDAFSYPFWSQSTQFSSIYLERRNYWEGPEGTVNGGTALVFGNTDDGAGTVNTAAITAGTVGDLPASTRVEITNSTNDGFGMSTCFLGHWNDADWVQYGGAGPTYTFTHHFEAEGTAFSGGTVLGGTAQANDSGGQIRQYVLSSGTAITEMFTLALTTNYYAASGRYFHFLVRFGDATPVDYGWRFQLRFYDGAFPVWEGPLTVINSYNQIQDLGVIQLPPWLQGMSYLKPLSIRICASQTSGTAQNIGIDYVQLIPADSWRTYTPLGVVAYQSRLVDDDINDRLYVDNGSGVSLTGGGVAIGKPLTLEPNRENHIYFLRNGGNLGAAAITETVSIKVFYRPRKLSI